MLEKINEILDFWFGGQPSLWWAKDPAVDAQIKERFEPVLYLATQGALKPWLEQPKSCLAYIILLDQFSRNMYRNTPLAFAQDPMALQACHYGRDHKLDKELPLIERLFFYMPLMHSEQLASQKLCLMLLELLLEEAKQQNSEHSQGLERALEFSQHHYDIIQNFGRFPHRNAILERESTQEELLFLSLPNSSF